MAFSTLALLCGVLLFVSLPQMPSGQGQSIPGGKITKAAPAPSNISASIFVDEVTSSKGWDLAATPSKSPAADRFADAPLQLTENASTEASDSHSAPAPAPASGTSPDVASANSAPPPSVTDSAPPSPSAAGGAPPPASGKMCHPHPVCEYYTDEKGDDIKICRRPPRTHPNRANLCPDDFSLICIVLFSGGVALLFICLGGCCGMCVRRRPQRVQDEGGSSA